MLIGLAGFSFVGYRQSRNSTLSAVARPNLNSRCEGYPPEAEFPW